MVFYPNADRSVIGNSGGSYTSGPFKGVFHTTEGSSASGAISAFKKNNSWPHFLVDYDGKVWQFVDTNVSSRALRNLGGGVETNRDSAIQIEVVGFVSKPDAGHPQAQIDSIKALMRWIESTHGVKSQGPGRPFATKYGQNNLRFSGAEWDSFGAWCFPKETFILTKDGLKDIAEIRVGEEVLTHLGRWRKVTKTMSRISDTVVIKGHGHYGLVTTSEHPFLASTRNKSKDKKSLTTLSSPNWVEAKNLEGKYWFSPTEFPASEIPPIEPARYAKTEVVMNPDLFWLIGRWLGDGCVDNKGKFQIACHIKEVEELCSHIPFTYFVSTQSNRPNTANIIFKSLSLGSWVTKHFGKYAIGKHIPTWLLGAPKEYRQELLSGYLSADGSICGENSNQYCSISKKLAFGIKLLAQSLGSTVSVYKDYREGEIQIQGRVAHQLDRYRCRVAFPRERWSNYTLFHENMVGSRIAYVNESAAEIVYNISVEEDESYIADGIIVHNCGHCHVPENDHYDGLILTDFNLLLPPPGYTVPASYFTEVPIVPFSVPRSQGGFIVVGQDGGVFAFDGAPFYGSMYGTGAHVIAGTWTPSGNGYWLLGDDGGVFSFGDAAFHGGLNGSPDLGNRKPIGIAAEGNGYAIVALDPSNDGSPFDTYRFGV